MSERDPMDLLWETFAAKTLGNVMHVSSGIEAQKEAFEMAIESLSRSIAEFAKRSGLIYIGGEKAMVRPEWHSDAKTVAMKCYAAIGRSPEQFVCFAAHLVEQEREKTESQVLMAEEWRGKYTRLLEDIVKSKSHKDLRLLAISRQREDN